MLIFYERLKELRLKNKLSQPEVAKEIGVSLQVYQRYEYGKTMPDLETIVKIMDFYNISLGYLIGRTDELKRNN